MRVILALGVPDAQKPGQRGKNVRLDGNTGLVAPLLTVLRERKLLARTEFLEPGGAPKAGDAQLLVNGVCEPIVHRRSLRRVRRWELAGGIPVVHGAGVIEGTARHRVAHRLAYQEAVHVPHCTLYGGTLPLPDYVERARHAYPVLLRPPGRHGSNGLVRVDDAKAAAAAGFKAGHVTDFVDFRSPDGHYRKYRLVLAGDTLFRRHILTGNEWNLTGPSRKHMVEHPELIAQEKAWLAQPVTLEPGSVEARVMHQFRALSLEFGSIDYALVDGRVVVFEINACVQLTGSIPKDAKHDWRYLEANNGVILDTLLAHLERRARSKR